MGQNEDRPTFYLKVRCTGFGEEDQEEGFRIYRVSSRPYELGSNGDN